MTEDFRVNAVAAKKLLILSGQIVKIAYKAELITVSNPLEIFKIGNLQINNQQKGKQPNPEKIPETINLALKDEYTNTQSVFNCFAKKMSG
ncbi:hypothetical protein DRQ07_09775 [candidate division KSB1 bacterium]|nr:MAG: hypothetical protein DRQ07_09775 [candidate division KSB1 bacterium]